MSRPSVDAAQKALPAGEKSSPVTRTAGTFCLADGSPPRFDPGSRASSKSEPSSRSSCAPASVSILLLRNSCVPARDRLTLTVHFLRRTIVSTEYKQMYLLLPPARTQDPSVLYLMVLKALVPVILAAVLRSENFRPPDTSRRPSIPPVWLASDIDQNVS